MDQNEKQKKYIDKLVEHAIQTTQENYFIIGKKHILSWKVWLILGVLTGGIGSIVWIANRSGEFKQSQANISYNVRIQPVNQLTANQAAVYNKILKSQSGTPVILSNNMVFSDKDYLVANKDLEKNIVTAAVVKASSTPLILANSNDFIIELNEEPLAEENSKFKKEVKRIGLLFEESTSTSTRNELQGNLDRLNSSHQETMTRKKSALIARQNSHILRIASIAPNAKIKRKFLNTFNGLQVEIDQKSVEKLKKAGFKIWRNERVQIALNESVPLIKADTVWQLKDSSEQNLTGKGIKIAIIDSGVDYTHPDLGGCLGNECKVAGGYDIVNSDNDPKDDFGHGTHVAAIAAGKGMLNGVAPDATLYAYKVLDDDGFGTFADIIEGINLAVDPNSDGNFSDGANVLNISIGGQGNPEDPPSQAVNNAVNAGAVVVVAAGNSGPRSQSILSPGTAKNAITVGASTKNDEIIWFSSSGPVIWNNKSLLKPDVVAPGVNICGAEWGIWLSDFRCNDDRHISISGTSMAAPHIAGVSALMTQKNPNWTPLEIKSAIRTSAKYLNDDFSKQGYGRVDALAAINYGRPPTVELNIPQFTVNKKINITGTAKGDNFARFTLSYGIGSSPLNFIEFHQSNTPINNGILYSNFDTEKLSDGLITIKLLATNNQGVINEDRILLNINNLEITSTSGNLNYVRGQTQIFGKISYSAISSYKIEVYSETSPNITTLCQINGLPPSNGQLCTFNADILSQNGAYYLKLSVLKEGNWLQDDKAFKVGIINELMSNWPLAIDSTPWGILTTANFDEDKETEMMSSPTGPCINIIIGWFDCYGSRILFFDSQGTYNDITTLSNNSPAPSLDWPTVYFDKTTDSNYLATLEGNRMGLIDKEGIVTQNGPEIYTGNWWNTTPEVIFDYNGDGKKEYYSIIKTFYFYESSSSWKEVFKIYGVDITQGTLLQGFPVTLNPAPNFQYNFPGNQILLLKNDGKTDLVYSNFLLSDSSNNFGYITNINLNFRELGTNITRQFILFNDENKSVFSYNPKLAGADFNNDGKTDLAVAYSIIDANLFLQDIYNPESYKTYLKIIDSSGSILWQSPEIKGYTIGGLAIADLDGNEPDIILHLDDTWPTTFQGQKIMAFKGSGNLLWEKNMENFNDIITGIAAGDINSDAKTDIIVAHRPRWWDGSASGIQILDASGNFIKKIVIPTLGAVDLLGQPILTDFDGDGFVDLLLQTYYLSSDGTKLETRFYPVKLNGVFNNSTMEWPMFLANPQHTSIWENFLSPTSGFIGTTVIIPSSNITYTPSANDVYFGGVKIATVNSVNGKSLSFNVPREIVGQGKIIPVTQDEFEVYVINGNGNKSYTWEFNVTSPFVSPIPQPSL